MGVVVGSIRDLVGVDSECDSWVLETIHGVASGLATIKSYHTNWQIEIDTYIKLHDSARMVRALSWLDKSTQNGTLSRLYGE